MRILMISRDIDVKQYHIATALGQKHQVFVYSTTKRFDWKGALKEFPSPRRMGRAVLLQRPYLMKDKWDIQPFTIIKNESDLYELYPDIIYAARGNDALALAKEIKSHCCENIEASGRFTRLVYDLEDCVLASKDVIPETAYQTRVMAEAVLINDKEVDAFLFGSEGERLMAVANYHDMPNFSPEKAWTLGPYVARATLPENIGSQNKLKKFTCCYAGAIWQKGGYSNVVGLIREVAKYYSIHVYMSNSYNSWNWRAVKKLEKESSNIHVHKRVPFDRIHYELSKYHVGICLAGEFKKLQLTFGMKPFTYAYAGVLPVIVTDKSSIDQFPIVNHTNGNEFGCVSSARDLRLSYKFRKHLLNDFDKEIHLMDNHVHRIFDRMGWG